MEQNLSWKKASLASALLHVVIAVLFAIGLAEIVAEKEQQTYVVDLATSNFSQGSGHEGGGGGAAAITGGVGEALVATASGLCVAIIAFCFYTYFDHQLDTLVTDTERLCSTVLGAKKESWDEA